MIVPTLGRIVWFTPSNSISQAMPTHEGRCAALVVKVWHQGLVNLTVFDADGNIHICPSVRLVQEGEPKPSGYFCEWMDWQIEQARKHAQADDGK